MEEVAKLKISVTSSGLEPPDIETWSLALQPPTLPRALAI
jgi:hypothetical protein